MKYEYRPTQFVHNFKGMTKKKKGKKKNPPLWNDSQPSGGKNVCLSWHIAAYWTLKLQQLYTEKSYFRGF